VGFMNRHFPHLCCCTDHHHDVKRHPSVAAASADPETLQRNSNQLPEYIEEFLDYGNALSCAFNPFGTLLASESCHLAKSSCQQSVNPLQQHLMHANNMWSASWLQLALTTGMLGSGTLRRGGLRRHFP
jgi:hypothetical protein